jgi:hypothetical protein
MLAAVARSRWEEARSTAGLLVRIAAGRNPYNLARKAGTAGPVVPDF